MHRAPTWFFAAAALVSAAGASAQTINVNLYGHSERLPSKPGSAGERGNGFGLVLARQTAQRMGGALELGRPARGAEVLLRFPAAEV